VDAHTALPDWTQRHAQSCPGCRQFYESAKTLAQQLSASVDKERLPSAFLHGKIMSAIRAQENVELQPARGRLVWAIAVGTACVLLAGIVWLREPTAPGQNKSGPTSVPAELALNVSVPSATQVGQWTKTFDGPLENETQLVLNDAKAAFDSLKSSLLPDNLVASSPESPLR
jgi:predicted anti-sigma-YlaC factor YlaD